MSEMSKATEAKYNKSETFLGFIGRFPNAILAVTDVSTFGVKKHEVPMGDMSYIDVPDAINVYREALSRHLIQEELEGLFDSDSNLLHAAHEAWNAMARLECLIRNLKEGEENEDHQDWDNRCGAGMCGCSNECLHPYSSST